VVVALVLAEGIDLILGLAVDHEHISVRLHPLEVEQGGVRLARRVLLLHYFLFGCPALLHFLLLDFGSLELKGARAHFGSLEPGVSEKSLF
jgi:hypothetical protein